MVDQSPARQSASTHFVIIGCLTGGGASLGAAGEITNVTQALQPSARWAALNSLQATSLGQGQVSGSALLPVNIQPVP
jgi:hypothetical protein